MHFHPPFGGLVTIALLIVISVLTLVSIGEGLGIFVNHQRGFTLQKRDDTTFTLRLPWNAPILVSKLFIKKDSSAAHERLESAIKNAVAAILEDGSTIQSSISAKATSTPSTLIAIPGPLDMTSLTPSDRIKSSAASQISMDTSLVGELVNAASSIVDMAFAVTKESNLGVSNTFQTSSGPSTSPIMIIYENEPIQKTVKETPPQGATYVPLSTLSSFFPSGNTPVLPVFPSTPHNLISMSSIALGSSLSTVSPLLTSIQNTLHSTQSFVLGERINSSKSTSMMTQNTIFLGVSKMSPSALLISTLTITSFPFITTLIPLCPGPVTKTCTVTETWHSTQYAETATLFSFMSIVTVTYTEIVRSVCPSSAAYLLSPPAVNQPSLVNATMSTVAPLSSFGSTHPMPDPITSTIEGYHFNPPSLPTGSLAPTVGAGDIARPKSHVLSMGTETVPGIAATGTTNTLHAFGDFHSSPSGAIGRSDQDKQPGK